MTHRNFKRQSFVMYHNTDNFKDYLDKNLPKPKETLDFSYEKSSKGGCSLVRYFIRGRIQLPLYGVRLFAQNLKRGNGFDIVCVLSSVGKNSSVDYMEFEVLVSRKKMYTKEELEQAEKSLMVKVLEGLKKAPGTIS